MGLLSSRYRNYKENGQNYGTCFSSSHSHPPLPDTVVHGSAPATCLVEAHHRRGARVGECTDQRIAHLDEVAGERRAADQPRKFRPRHRFVWLFFSVRHKGLPRSVHLHLQTSPRSARDSQRVPGDLCAAPNKTTRKLLDDLVGASEQRMAWRFRGHCEPGAEFIMQERSPRSDALRSSGQESVFNAATVKSGSGRTV